MSRTDVHRPWRVQIADPHNRPILYRYPAYGPGGTDLTSFRNIGCGCKLCTSQEWRKHEHRRDRMRWRAKRQDALKTSGDERETIT